MANKSDNSQICAILAYFLVGIIWFFFDEKLKKNSLAKFHVKQAIILIVFAVIWNFVVGFLAFFLVFLGPVLWIIANIPVFMGIYGIFNALNKKETALPIIGGLASKLDF